MNELNQQSTSTASTALQVSQPTSLNSTTLQVPQPQQDGASVIQIDRVTAVIGAFVLVAGIILGAGKILGKIDSLGDRLKRIEDYFDDIIKDKFASANSPRQLNDRGNKLLTDSRVKQFIDSNRGDFLALAKAKSFSNPYDAEKGLLEILRNYVQERQEDLKNLKEHAFNSGTDIESVYFVGSIYLRNQIFTDLGFQLDDLD